MKVEIDEKSGFCFGVVKAINKVEELVLNARSDIEPKPVYCLGDIVHNGIEVKRLTDMGMKTIDIDHIKELEPNSTLLIRAHGEPPTTYQTAKDAGINIVDATCAVVAKLQKIVVDAYNKMKLVDGQVVILGKKGHPEVVGLSGQIAQHDGRIIVVENIDDISKSIDFSRPIYLLSQTTQSLELFEQVRQLLLSQREDCIIHDTICRQVSNRNPHLKEFAGKHDVIIFVSGKKSSNGKALYQACLSVNDKTYFVEDQTQIDMSWFDGCNSVGICGATSTPRWIMDQVAESIKSYKK